MCGGDAPGVFRSWGGVHVCHGVWICVYLNGSEHRVSFSLLECICMLRVHAGMGGVGSICILMCERAQLAACRGTGMFGGALWLYMCSDTSVLERVLP